ncbi:hypothetical protein PG997_006205 [Apiospora hydei]|uniref:Uncharacterized protein n=1 Tax=Apiospora hydei TaxID=1337664 RepID=A0ABR1WRL8_9PEZI
MQTVPSLIASGTAIAAAATGLVFGQPAENHTFQPRGKPQESGKHPTEIRYRPYHPPSLCVQARLVPPWVNRQPTDSNIPPSWVLMQPYGQGARSGGRFKHKQRLPRLATWRRSSLRQSDAGSGTAATEESRDSLSSSNGSWIRRLSIRPMSQHESVKSSLGPDSPSLFSPMDRVNQSSGKQLTAEAATPPASKFSHDSRARPRAQTLGLPAHEPALDISANDNSTWRSFFHARIARIAARASPISRDSQPGPKRICLERASSVQGAYLVSPRSVLQGPPLPPMQELSWDADTLSQCYAVQNSQALHVNAFQLPTNWISRSGSLRRRKRGAIGTGATDETLRQVSDPTPTVAHSGCPQGSPHVGRANSTGGAGTPSRAETDLAAIFQPPHQSSNSPLPSLSRLSSFHMDLSRMGSPTNMMAQSNLDSKPASSANPPTLRVNSNVSHSRTLERASTVASSDYHRGFTSGDDDDTDFKTDTPYDSLRTAGSGRQRTLDSPVESMFDESPPSTAGNNKPKRLSIQEILGPTYDGGNRIMEEDESLPTPVGATFDEAETHFRLASLQGDESFKYTSITPDLPRVSTGTDFSRLSFDEDDALDWAREDEHPVYNHLSPPSSMNSRGGSPSLRMALASITGNAGSNPDLMRNNERPRSNIFDWTETAQHDKLEGEDIIDNSKPKFGTWGLGSKNVSEDWDEDFEFEEDADAGFSEGVKAGNRLSMVVPASIAATQPTVKAHSGQIRELREMDMLTGSSATLWREAEGIIALASPDEDDADTSATNVQLENLEPQLADDRFIDEGFDGSALEEQSHRGKISDQMKTAVVKERPAARRRSVFSPEDDIFGNFQQSQDGACETPKTPDTQQAKLPFSPSSVARSLMESMQLRRREPTDGSDDESANGRLNFDTNSLKELVKRAGDLRDSLSDIVRKADHITQTPVRTTPRRDRSEKNEDGSPAFTRVFNDPSSSSPAKRIPHSHSSSSVLSGGTMNTPSPNGLSQRLQMMTVN